MQAGPPAAEEAWAARFPRRDTDVFAVAAEVAESVAVAAAWARIALARTAQTAYGFETTPRDTLLARGRDADREAFAQLGSMYYYLLDSARSETAHRRALALNPDRRMSWQQLFYARWYNGHLAEASEVLDACRARAPGGSTL
jgi:hypothetical protein